MLLQNGKPVVVLVDAEQVDAAMAEGCIRALATKFSPLILHAFGDFRGTRLHLWRDLLDRYHGQALQVTPLDAQPHGMEICITMNAMDIMHEGAASAFYLFCGQSDYSQLAIRIRQEHLPVFGFGHGQPGMSLAPWFDSWTELESSEASSNDASKANREGDEGGPQPELRTPSRAPEEIDAGAAGEHAIPKRDASVMQPDCSDISDMDAMGVIEGRMPAGSDAPYSSKRSA